MADLFQYNDVFISYQWDIQQEVAEISDFLRSNNLRVWRDQNNLRVGDRLIQELSNAIKYSKVFVCFITRKYDTSKMCQLEINWALDLSRPLIVVMFENVRPTELPNIGMIINPIIRINYFEDPNKDELLQEIIKNITNSQPMPVAQRTPVAQPMPVAQTTPIVESYPKGTIILNAHRFGVSCIVQLSEFEMASGGFDTTIKIWELRNYSCVRTLLGHTDSLACLQKIYHYFLVSGSADRTIKIWNLNDYSCVRTLTEHTGRVSSLAIIDENLFSSGSYDRTIKIWNRNEGSSVITLNEHNNCVTCLEQINQDTLSSGSDDRTIKIWNVHDGSCLRTFRGHGGSLINLKKIEESRLASISRDRTIKIWDVNDGSCIKTINREITNLFVFSNDKKHLIEVGNQTINAYLTHKENELIKVSRYYRHEDNQIVCSNLFKNYAKDKNIDLACGDDNGHIELFYRNNFCNIL